jgi:hypothetical protein
MAPLRDALLVLAVLALPVSGPRAARASEDEPAAADAAARAFEKGLSREQVATVRFLEHVGIRFVEDAAATEVVPPRAGEPVVRLPKAMTPAQTEALGASLAGIADSVPARLGYQERLHDAAQRALKRLADNATSGRYTFPKVLVFDSWFWSVDPPEPEWVRVGDVHRPRGSPSDAIEAFYEKPASLECYAAQVVATYAIQYELYGREAFDEAFRPEELGIGTPEEYHKTEFGRHMLGGSSSHPWLALLIGREDRREDAGMVLARYGPKAFTGVTGIIRDLCGSDISNENFVIASVSPAALEVLRTRGFRFVAQQTNEAHEALEATRRRFATGPLVSESRKKVAAVLSNPVFTEIKVYVHPYGIVPLRELVEDKLKRDKNAVGVGPYLHGREDAFFRRYRESFVRRWLAANPGD